MLACVVGIPVVALWGSSWSEMRKKIEDFHWTSLLDMASASPATSQDEAPRFTPAKPANKQVASVAAMQPTQAGFLGLVSPSPTASAPQNQPAAVQSGVIPAGYQAPAESAAMARPVLSAVGQNATDVARSAADPFSALQDRLRRLGATYYLLESWGSDQQMYRFYCKMAVGGSADYTRYFEATNTDPLQAMLGVVRQVESWRDGGKIEELGTKN
jgi:hypothetical protein